MNVPVFTADLPLEVADKFDERSWAGTFADQETCVVT
jgi:hypothetical protein